MSEPFLGEIRMFAANFAPRGWAFCDGQLLRTGSYDALFFLLGTTYGGDGEYPNGTFALPDLRGRVPVHPGEGPAGSNFTLGQKGGVENVTLQTANLPAHVHGGIGTAAAVNQPATSTDPEGRAFAIPSDGSLAYAPSNQADDYLGGAVDVDASGLRSGLTGGNLGHPNLQPFQVINYIIALFGVFPSET